MAGPDTETLNSQVATATPAPTYAAQTLQFAGPSPLADSLNATLKSAPELGTSPGLAVSVATGGGDVAGRAQGIARTTNALSDASVRQDVQHSVGGDISSALNWFGDSVQHVASKVVGVAENGVKDVTSDVGGVLNAQLSYVQHEYRFLHDVEARHGPWAALTLGIGLAVGAGAGYFATDSVYGAELGGEAAVTAEGFLLPQYRDSWNATANGARYTDPHTHLAVSFGRDVASVLGLRPGTLWFNIGSGLIDGIADMQVGGSEDAGLIGKARSIEGLGRDGTRLHELFPGISALTSEDFENAYNSYRSVKNAMSDIAGKSAGDIIATPAYQSLIIKARNATPADQVLTTNDFIAALGRATSADDVAGVFRDALRTHELVGMDTVPTLSFTRRPFQLLREALESNDTTLRAARNFIRLPSATDLATGEVSHEVFDPTDPNDNGAVALYRTLMYSENRRTAASVVASYINGNVADRVRIYRNAMVNTLLAMSEKEGLDRGTLSRADMRAIKAGIDNFTGGAEPGVEGWYAMNDQRGGENISMVRDTLDGDRQYAAAVTDNQTGKLQIISLDAMRSAAREIAQYRSIFGRVGSHISPSSIAPYETASDFLYEHVTQNLFKPLVLLTPSYALHISLAELIPNALRLGVGNIVKAALAENVAKLGRRASEEYDDKELKAISGLAWQLVGGDRANSAVSKALGDTPDDELGGFAGRVRNAARYIDMLGGDKVMPGLSAGHAYSNEIAREQRTSSLLRTNVANTPLMRGKEFGQFGRSDEHFLTTWRDWLNHSLVKDEKTQIAARTMISSLRSGRTLTEASQDAAASVSTWLHEQPQSYLDRYMRGDPRYTSLAGDRPLGTDHLDEWAQVVVSNLRGALRKPRGTGGARAMHMDLLDHVAYGEPVHLADLESIPERERPENVIGRKIVPQPPDNVIQKAANYGFKRLLDPMVNFISREPIAFAEWERQYARYFPKIEAGLVSDDEAMTLAAAKSAQIVMRNVHNLADRTQWTVALRNWAPFFFAQEQAYRRMGRLLASDPRAFRRYQLMISNLHDIGQVLGGQNGQSYFVIPHTGWLTPTFLEGASRFFPITGSSPVGMGWNLSSMSVVFPLSSGARVDVGPVVGIPIQAIASFWPEMGAPALKGDVSSLENAVLGQSAASPIWEQLIPNVAVQRLMQAWNGGTILPDRSFDSTVMQTMAAMDYQGYLPKPGEANVVTLQQSADRIRNLVRVWYVAKALVGLLTPVSPEVQVSGSNLRTQYDADAAAWSVATEPGAGTLAQQGFSPNQLGFPPELNEDIAREGSLTKGIHAYLEKHPDATAATVFEAVHPGALPFTVSQSGSSTGAYIYASTQAESWINDHAELFSKYPLAAVYLMPQPTDTKYNPAIYNEQLAQGLRVKLSPDQYTDDGQLPSYINQLYIAAGNEQFFNGPYAQYKQAVSGLTGEDKYNVEQQFYNVTLPAFEKQNPIWAQYWTSDTKGQVRNQVVTELQQMFAAGDAPAGPLTDEIRQLLTAYQANQAQLTYGAQTNYASESQSEIDANWQNTLQTAAFYYPELRAFINGVFMDVSANAG